MELVYVIKGFNINGEQRRWCISESMVPTNMAGGSEVAMKKMAEDLAVKLESQGWYIINKDIGMMWDDRRGYDFMNTWGSLNEIVAMPTNVYNSKGNKVYPDEK